MVEKELKWYDIFMVLFGTILSFADPITDVLTLVEFYRADHKTWFGVGLTFVIFSCVAFSVNYYAPKESELKGVSRARRYTQVFLCGLNPFSPALVKLQTFIFYLKNFKKLWRGDKIKPSYTGTAVDEEAYVIPASNNISVLYEAMLESAPQFIIQLYAMVAQKEPVKVVQTVSLPVSFLCLVWASTVVDDVIYGKEEDRTENYMAHETNKLLLFLTHFFVLSSRLIAIALFTVSVKWWITTALIFHSIAIVICDVGLFYPRGECNVTFARLSNFYFCLHWLPDDLSMRIDNRSSAEKKKEGVKKNADVLQRVVCDRKHHHDLVI